MSNKLYEEQHIQNIADAIREKTGKTDTMLVSQMEEEIRGISSSGASSVSFSITGKNVNAPIHRTNSLILAAPTVSNSVNYTVGTIEIE